jgi:DNA-binding LacI/PurR family transcriptional regulator
MTTTADGARRVTLAQVAARARVSVMTASYTYSRPARVSEATRTKVLKAAAELGYAGPDPSARSLRRGRTATLGVVLGERLGYAFADPQAAVFLAGIADVCADREYGLTILPITGSPGDADRVRRAAVDGFVVWTTSDDDPVLAAIQAVHRPAVVHSGPPVDGLGLVGIDNRAAARAIGRLAFAGAQRPAVLSFPTDRGRGSGVRTGLDPATATFPVTRDRLAGFRDAAVELGLSWSEVNVAVCARNNRVEAEQAARELLAADARPDAVAAMSDEQAAGVLAAAATARYAVPDQVAVTGFDDSAIAHGLGLTTVAQSLGEQGRACARAVLDDDIASARGLDAPWAIVGRSSTRGGST